MDWNVGLLWFSPYVRFLFSPPSHNPRSPSLVFPFLLSPSATGPLLPGPGQASEHPMQSYTILSPL